MPLEVALRHLAAADCMDIELAAMPQYLRRSTYIRAALKKMGLNATAVSLGVPFFFSDSRLDLNSPKRSVREASLRYVRKSVDLASQLEADLIYACSMKRGAQAELGTALEHFRQAVAECSDYAKGAAVRFAIEPFPTGLLPTLRETNAFIREMRSDNLGVLLDTGHAAISDEDLGEATRRSKGTISHVHINNNDGIRDLHWPPQRGKLTDADFRSLLTELVTQDYRGKVSIELSKPRPVVGTILRSRQFVDGLLSDFKGPASSGSQISS
jgi:D-psicose/D-tagatose/L-ribulose 3-epimerase